MKKFLRRSVTQIVLKQFNLLKDLTLLQTKGVAVRNKLNILWTEGNKCYLWKLLEQILAAHSIVLDTSAGFSSVRALKNYLKTSCSASFVAKWSTYSFKASLFVLNVTYFHLMIDATQFTEKKYAYRFSEKIIFNQQTEIYPLTGHI